MSAEVPYADAHHREISLRQGEEGFVPFMHLGEFDEGSRTPPISAAAFERAQRALTEGVFAQAGLSTREDVLEVGCGFGGNLALLAGARRAGRLVGLDLGERQIELARRIVGARAGAPIEWVVGDATRLPFADESFDVVLAIECVFHFPSRRAFAFEARRVLRPGGRLVLTDFVAGEEREAQRDGFVEDLPDRDENDAILRAELDPFPDVRGEEGDWVELGRAAGLDVVHRCDITEAVWPSFEHILADKPRDPRAHRDRNDRGAAALSLALSRGSLRMERWAFERSTP